MSTKLKLLGVDIQVLNKVPGLDHKHNLQTTKLDLSYSETFNETHLADAYERLLLETMRGIQAFFCLSFSSVYPKRVTS
jgi:glucose-6-phosphate 1-dehydrogenase